MVKLFVKAILVIHWLAKMEVYLYFFCYLLASVIIVEGITIGIVCQFSHPFSSEIDCSIIEHGQVNYLTKDRKTFHP